MPLPKTSLSAANSRVEGTRSARDPHRSRMPGIRPSRPDGDGDPAASGPAAEAVRSFREHCDHADAVELFRTMDSLLRAKKYRAAVTPRRELALRYGYTFSWDYHTRLAAAEVEDAAREADPV